MLFYVGVAGAIIFILFAGAVVYAVMTDDGEDEQGKMRDKKY